MSPARKIERRRLHRLVKRIPATFEAGKLRGTGHIKNVSKKGLFLRTGLLPPVGSDVRVLFSDRKGTKIALRGRVRWTTDQLPAGEKAKPGFAVYIRLDDKAFAEFFEQILFS